MIDLQLPPHWATWQELGTESKRNPESVFSMILEAKVGTAGFQHHLHLILEKPQLSIHNDVMNLFFFFAGVCPL